jgi:hypothetical protein
MALHTIAPPFSAMHNDATMPMTRELTKESLGYQLHTNRELGMMLRGEKPLAVFSEVDGLFVWVVPRYLRLFDSHAAAGRFIRREHCKPRTIEGKPRTLVTILYALPDEAWRIDAMIELRGRLDIERWTEAHERREGSLLGYTDAQNDAWIAWRRTQR